MCLQLPYHQPPFDNIFFNSAFRFSKASIFLSAASILLNRYAARSEDARLPPHQDESAAMISFNLISSSSQTRILLSELAMTFSESAKNISGVVTLYLPFR